MKRKDEISLKERVRFGNQLAALVEKRGITLGLLAQITGISKSHLYLIRRGKRAPSPECAKKIHDVLKSPLRCPHCGQFIGNEE